MPNGVPEKKIAGNAVTTFAGETDANVVVLVLKVVLPWSDTFSSVVFPNDKLVARRSNLLFFGSSTGLVVFCFRNPFSLLLILFRCLKPNLGWKFGLNESNESK